MKTKADKYKQVCNIWYVIWDYIFFRIVTISRHQTRSSTWVSLTHNYTNMRIIQVYKEIHPRKPDLRMVLDNELHLSQGYVITKNNFFVSNQLTVELWKINIVFCIYSYRTTVSNRKSNRIFDIEKNLVNGILQEQILIQSSFYLNQIM